MFYDVAYWITQSFQFDFKSLLTIINLTISRDAREDRKKRCERVVLIYLFSIFSRIFSCSGHDRSMWQHTYFFSNFYVHIHNLVSSQQNNALSRVVQLNFTKFLWNKFKNIKYKMCKLIIINATDEQACQRVENRFSIERIDSNSNRIEERNQFYSSLFPIFFLFLFSDLLLQCFAKIQRDFLSDVCRIDKAYLISNNLGLRSM